MVIEIDELNEKLKDKKIYDMKYQKYIYQNEIVSPFNVLYIKIADEWSSIIIDDGALIYYKNISPALLLSVKEGDHERLIESITLLEEFIVSRINWCMEQSKIEILSKGKMKIEFIHDNRVNTLRYVENS